MVKIKISYESQEEVREILKTLQPYIKHMKGQNAPQGKYKRLYIEVKDHA